LRVEPINEPVQEN
jgi:hypothetical protein